MTYEARHSRLLNYALAGASLLLSLIGFAAAGVIPTESGSNPPVGWAIVAACAVAAIVFIRRATDRRPLVRIDDAGIYVRAVAPDPIPWDEFVGMQPMRLGIQQIVRFELRNPAAIAGARGLKPGSGKLSYGHFGVNTTFYDRRMPELVAAARHHRPGLA